MVAEGTPSGGNATRSRSQRARHPSARQPATGAAEQRPEQEQGQEQEDQGFVLPILNWVLVFFLMQNVMGMLVAQFNPRPENGNVVGDPASPSDYDGARARDFALDGEDDAAARTKMKPVGASEKSNYNANQHLGGPGMKLKPACLWTLGTVMDLDVLITDSPRVPDGWPALTTPIEDDESAPKGGGKTLASWRQEGLIYGGIAHEADSPPGVMSFFSSNANQAMNHRNATLTVPLTKQVWNNETHVYAHVRLQRNRKFKDNKKRPVRKDDVLVKRAKLTRHRKRKKNRDVKSLLDAPSEDSSATVDPDDSSVLTAASLNKTHEQLLLYMKPSLTLQVVDMGSMGVLDFPSKESIPKQFSDHMDWYEGEDGGGTRPLQDLYYPILYSSEFWITFSSLKEVNGTLKESTLDVTYEPVPVRITCCC